SGPTSRPKPPPRQTIRRRRPVRSSPDRHGPEGATMAELVMVDRAVVQALNHAAQPQPLRLLVLLVATVLAAGPPLLLAILAVQALRRRDPASLAIVVLAGLGG